MLIQAFHAEFGHDPKVQLKIHGRGRWFDEFKLTAIKQNLKVPLRKKEKFTRGTHSITHNIELILGSLSAKDYKNFFTSLDCYVLISKGEGFSITPREALALGKPCIISNNTAHQTIARTGCVYAVPSEIEEPAFYAHLGGYFGNYFNCTVEDVRAALREVYEHYSSYQDKALMGRKWVERYLWKNVKAEFRNLIKPQEVILGHENKLTEHYIMTTSQELYKKYYSLNNNIF